MKNLKEITENVERCKIKLQESYDNMANDAATLTSQDVTNYKKTQSYIKGWIDALSDAPNVERIENPEYGIGYKNGIEWMNS